MKRIGRIARKLWRRITRADRIEKLERAVFDLENSIVALCNDYDALYHEVQQLIPDEEGEEG